MLSGAMSGLKERVSGGGKVLPQGSSGLRLQIPPGPPGKYRLAQVDDYLGLPRNKFPWSPELSLRWEMRASARESPGTWGVGFWNDPFGLAFIRGGGIRIPVLPNAAWFFVASPQNYLSLRDDLSGNGYLAAVFRSPENLPLSLFLGLPLLPLFFLPAVARWWRGFLRRYIKQDSCEFNLDLTEWHHYGLEWHLDGVCFLIDGQVLKEMSVYPNGKLGLVIWIDNQYASWTPAGRLKFGTLANSLESWVEMRDLEMGFA